MKPLRPAALAALATALLAGCASSTPNYDARFGDAVRQARQAMALNPTPSATATPAVADGRSVQEATGRYHESFKTPPPVVNVINIGGSPAGGGSR